jgi:hypothetical protein
MRSNGFRPFRNTQPSNPFDRYLIDPLQLKPNTRTVALAAMIGAVIFAMALGESVTIEGIAL